jgi:hypothetical protein
VEPQTKHLCAAAELTGLLAGAFWVLTLRAGTTVCMLREVDKVPSEGSVNISSSGFTAAFYTFSNPRNSLRIDRI